MSAPVVFSIGDVGVGESTIVTPNGTASLAGSNWIVTDRSREVSVIPTYAIVLTVVFTFLFLIGLLFLLVREKVIQGFVEVTVQAEGLYHVTQVRVTSTQEIDRLTASVNEARSMAHRLAAQQTENIAPVQRVIDAGAFVTHSPAGTKVCPQCAETVKAAARICRFCNHAFQP